MSNIKVAIKARPSLKKEKDLKSYWKITNNMIQHVDSVSDPFAFDHIFDENSSNKNLFDTVVQQIVKSSMEGINGTIFAYGQTSSGKTYTMLGDEENPGVIIYAIEEIFNYIQNCSDRLFLLRVSYIEIYNEKIYDLLKKNGTELKIVESNERNDVFVNCEEFFVTSVEDILKYLHLGSKVRKCGETNMNERSSRSHAIFKITVESRSKTANNQENGDKEDEFQISSLNLVDLAGSERANQTGATGNRLKEGSHINKSLLSLGCVIKSLSEMTEVDGFINYRNSKLTRILQASLGGNAVTAIICNIKLTTFEETHSTLSFAMRAKTIKNKPMVNKVISDAAAMKILERKVKKLQAELELERNKNGKLKVIELEKKIYEESHKIISNIKKEKNTTNRRRTWCPSLASNEISTKIETIEEETTNDIELTPKIFKSRLTGPFVTGRHEYNDNKDDDLIENTSFADLFLPRSEIEEPDLHTITKQSLDSTITPTLKDKVEFLEQELIELKDFINLEKTLDIDYNLLDNLKAGLEACQKELQNKNILLMSNQKEHLNLELNIENLNTEIKKLKLLVDEKNKEISNVKTCLDHEKREKVNKELEVDLIKAKHQIREAELLELINEKDEKLKKYQETGIHCNNCSTKTPQSNVLHKQKEILRIINQSDAVLLTTISEMYSKHGELEKSFKSMENELEENKSLIEELTSELNLHKSDSEKLKSLENQLEENKSLVEKLTSELNLHKSDSEKLKSLENQLEENKSLVEKLTSELNLHKSDSEKLKSLENQLEENKSLVEKLTSELNLHKSDSEKLKSLENQLEENKSLVEKLTSELNLHKSDSDKLKLELIDARNQTNLLDEENKTIKENIKHFDNECSILKEKVLDLIKEMNEIENEQRLTYNTKLNEIESKYLSSQTTNNATVAANNKKLNLIQNQIQHFSGDLSLSKKELSNMKNLMQIESNSFKENLNSIKSSLASEIESTISQYKLKEIQIVNEIELIKVDKDNLNMEITKLKNNEVNLIESIIKLIDNINDLTLQIEVSIKTDDLQHYPSQIDIKDCISSNFSKHLKTDDQKIKFVKQIEEIYLRFNQFINYKNNKENEIKNLNTEILKLNQNINNQSEKNTHFENTIHDNSIGNTIHDSIAAAANTMTEISFREHDLLQEVQNLKSQLETIQESLLFKEGSYSEEIASKEKQILTLATEIEDLKEKINEYELIKIKYLHETETLKTNLEDINKNYNEKQEYLNKQIEMKTNENARLVKINEELTKTKENFENSKYSKNSNESIKISNLNKEIEELKNTIEENDKIQTILIQENESLTNIVKNLNKKLNNKQENFNKLIVSELNLKQQIKEISDLNKEIQQQNEILIKEVEIKTNLLLEINSKFEDLNKNIEENEKIKVILIQENESLTNQVKNLQEQLINKEENFNKLIESKANVEKEVGKLLKANEEIINLNNTIKNFQEQHETLNKEIKTKTNLISDLNSKIEELQKNNNTINKNLEESKHKIHLLNQEIDSKTAEISNLNSQINKFKENIKEIEEIKTKNMKENENLKNKLKEIEEKLKLSNKEADINFQIKEQNKNLQTKLKEMSILKDTMKNLEKMYQTNLENLKQAQYKLSQSESRELKSIEENQNLIDQLQNLQDQFCHKEATLLKQIENKEIKTSELEAEIEELNNEIRDFEEVKITMKNLQQENLKIKEDTYKLNHNLKELKTKEKNYFQINLNIRDSLEKLKLQITEKENYFIEQIKLKEFRICELSKKIEELNNKTKEVSNLNETIKTLQEQLSMQNNQIVEYENKKSSTSSGQDPQLFKIEIERIKKQFNEKELFYNKEFSIKDSEIKQYKNDLNDKNEEIEKLNYTIDELENRNIKILKAFTVQKAKIKDQLEKETKYNEKIKQLKEELENKENYFKSNPTHSRNEKTTIDSFRKYKRQSFHDETRGFPFDIKKDASTLTDPTNELCNCLSLAEKVSDFKKQILIKDSQIMALNMKLNYNVMKDEIIKVKNQLSKEINEKELLNKEIQTLNKEIQSLKGKIKQDTNNKIIQSSSSKTGGIKMEKFNQETQTDGPETDTLTFLREEDLRKICRHRYKKIKNLEQQIEDLKMKMAEQ